MTRSKKADYKKADYILDDPETLPIMGWIGPQKEMIRNDVMCAMSEAGFNISLSQPSEGKLLEALDVAHAAGVRLMLMCGFDLGRMNQKDGKDYKLTTAQKKNIRKTVDMVKDHPGLYGYHIHDEPAHADLDWIAASIREIEELDSYHVCYVNHNAPVIQGAYGAGTQEVLWRDYIKKVRPRFLSFDHYPIEQKPRDFVASLGSCAPNAFGNIVVKPDYFAVLDFARWFSVLSELPLWAFTCSVPHWSYPQPTEGHIRFQLMCDLAYGSRGLQYFTYFGDKALCRSDGSTTETWEIARKVNRDIHILWKKLKGLRSIGVRHTGPLWAGVQPPMPWPAEQWGMDHLGLRYKCIGDPAVLGLFDDEEGNMYVLAVNRNPVESGTISLDPSLDDRVPHKWHPLQPGEGRLFKLYKDAPPEVVG